MTTVEPTKNHGRFLNVSQPKRKADPVENSMTAPYSLPPRWAGLTAKISTTRKRRPPRR